MTRMARAPLTWPSATLSPSRKGCDGERATDRDPREREQQTSSPAWWSSLVFAIVVLSLLAVLLDRLFPFPQAKLQRAPAVIVSARDGAPLRVFLPPDGRYRFPVTLEDVPPELIRALIASEDRHFLRHPGVDPVAMLRANWSNLRARRVVSGASTIPM